MNSSKHLAHSRFFSGWVSFGAYNHLGRDVRKLPAEMHKGGKQVEELGGGGSMQQGGDISATASANITAPSLRVTQSIHSGHDISLGRTCPLPSSSALMH